ECSLEGRGGGPGAGAARLLEGVRQGGEAVTRAGGGEGLEIKHCCRRRPSPRGERSPALPSRTRVAAKRKAGAMMTTPIDTLVSLAHPEGGWGYTAGQPAHLEPTCLALLALRPEAERYAPAASAGRPFLR